MRRSARFLLSIALCSAVSSGFTFFTASTGCTTTGTSTTGATNDRELGLVSDGGGGGIFVVYL
jgi:hypothetical protein